MKDLITHKLHNIVHSLDRLANELIKKKFGLDYTSFIILIALYKEADINQTQITSWCGLSKGMVSRVIVTLEEKGLITSIESKKDRRFKKIELTKKGKQTAKELVTFLEEEFINHILGGSSKVNQETLDNQLNNIISNINGYFKDGKHRRN